MAKPPSTWWAVLSGAAFRRLLAVRLVGQVADGLLQIGVAGFVFFSPERAADPSRIAIGLAVLLLPYSLVGPFVGVLIDRWSRRQVLLVANLSRSLGLVVLALLVALGAEGPAFYLLALVVLGINRFVLAALGAALPHVVESQLLVTANAIAPSAGTGATVLGAVIGAAIRAWTGSGDLGSAAAVTAAAVTCLLAGTLALRLGRSQLGPDHPVRLTAARAVSDVVRGVIAGLRHLRRRPPAGRALRLLAGYRFCYGAATVWVILLIRPSLFPADTDAGFAVLGLVVVATGIGVLLGALSTPLGIAWLDTARWTALVLSVAGVTQLLIGIAPRTWTLVIGAGVIAACVQSVKVGVDSVVQTTVADAFRGRVFTVYDLLFNASLVAAAAAAAAVLPVTGHSTLATTLMAVGYLCLAAWYVRGPAAPAGQPGRARHH